MIYSVYRPELGKYDYYAVGATPADANPPKAKLPASPDLGVAPEQAAWRLPRHARKVGTGAVAKGMIASPVGEAVDATPRPWWHWVIVGVVIAKVVL